MFTLGITILLSTLLVSNALQSNLSPNDKNLLKSVFSSGYSKLDVQNVFLSVRGFALLDEVFDHEKEACDLFKTTFLKSEKLNDLYAAAYGAHLIKSEKCQLDISKVSTVLIDLDKITNNEVLYKTVKILHFLNLEINKDAVKKSLENVLKKDSSALNQAYSYYIASQIFKTKNSLKSYFMEIEDTIQQADEADNTYMYYDDGVYTTAFILNSIFELSEMYEEAPPIPVEKLNKFSNYFLSRRYTYQLKTAVELTAVIKTLSKNKYKVPLVISVVDNGVVLQNNPKVKIAVSNLWGDKIIDAKVEADTVKNVQSLATIMTKKIFTVSTTPGIYELDMSPQDQLTTGFYSIKLNTNINDTRYHGGASVTFLVKLISSVNIENVELSIRERDQLTGTLNYKLTKGSLLSDKLNMNWHHRLEMKFVIRDNQRNLRLHQVFVKMIHLSTKQEIIFVAEADRSNLYKFGLDLEKSNKDFDNLSGEYSMELVIGDAVVSTHENWIFAHIKLDMPSTPSSESTGESRRSVAGSKRSAASPRIGKGPSVAKPQIFHMFKPAEKRGGQLISSVFTVLCVVPPFVIMIILWALLGVNMSHFQLAISPLLFHFGIISIFGLYYCYWSYLNMFTTLQYLIPLGAVTAFFGNRVLRQIASKRKEAY